MRSVEEIQAAAWPSTPRVVLSACSFGPFRSRHKGNAQRVLDGFFFFGVAGGTTTTGQGARRMSPDAVLPAKRS